MRPRVLIVVAAVSLLTAGAAARGLAAEEPAACTLIGCTSGVGINVAKAREDVDRLTFCVRERCRRIDIKRNGLAPATQVTVVCDSEITVLGVLTTRDEDGRKLDRYKALIPLRKTQPNGPECPPTCFQGSVRFNGARLVVQS